MEGENVYFKVRSNKLGESKVMCLHVKEFMRRFLLHVLPKGFVRIRHFGLLGNRFKKVKVALIRKLQGLKEQVITKATESWKELLEKVLGTDTDKCPHCETGQLLRNQSFGSQLSTA